MAPCNKLSEPTPKSNYTDSSQPIGTSNNGGTSRPEDSSVETDAEGNGQESNLTGLDQPLQAMEVSKNKKRKSSNTNPRAPKKGKGLSPYITTLQPLLVDLGLRVNPRRGDRMYPSNSGGNDAPDIIERDEDDEPEVAEQFDAQCMCGDRSADRDYILGLSPNTIHELKCEETFHSRLDEHDWLKPKPKWDKAEDKSKQQQQQQQHHHHRHLDYEAAPISDIYEIFEDMADKGFKLGVKAACRTFKGPLRIVTMCSGTESPVLSMKLMQRAFEKKNFTDFQFEHLASAEIEPFKQAYIQRNFAPPVIFQDVVEFSKDLRNENMEPRTAYGGTAKKPQDVHMLVAGSSCVDYSLLNRKPKDWSAKGESKSTMMGICDYAEDYHPNIVILENVKTAPWERVVEYWQGIGYAVQVVLVDSKDYYVPQTRQRGYMIGIYTKHAQEVGINTETLLADWVVCMKQFQRRASSPYTDFIHDENDPILEESKRALTMATRPATKSQDWAACRQRYANFRVGMKLGSLRPVTNWQNNGSCTFPDYAWHFWSRVQRERIWDTIDINQLVYVSLRDYDMTYKHRCINLSQNVDRETDAKHWGIVGCITPLGMPYDTYRGGPLTGRESLALQGIPVDELILTKETSSQLQDLAGNAMTSTVVGAAIFSAIIAGGGVDPETVVRTRATIFKDYSRHPGTLGVTSSQSNSLRTFEEIQSEMASPNPKQRSLNADVESTANDLMRVASRSRQLCLCEGFVGNKPGLFLQCRDCGHTACSDCSGHPPHNYRPLSSSHMNCRKSPGTFISAVTAALPRTLYLTSGGTGDFVAPSNALANPQDQRAYVRCVNAALKDIYHFSAVKRGSDWKVQYESPGALLELCFTPVFLHRVKLDPADAVTFLPNAPISCRWYLYAKCEKSEPADSPLRAALLDPVAQMLPKPALSVLEGKWKVRNARPDIHSFRVDGVSGQVDAWEMKLGLKDDAFTSLKSHSAISVVSTGTDDPRSVAKVEKVSGKFELLQKCVGASGLLHRRTDTPDDKPDLFLFLDPEPLGDAANDSCVVSYYPERRSGPDRRQAIGRFVNGWRPSPNQLGKVINCDVGYGWIERSLSLKCTPTQAIIDVCMPLKSKITFSDRSCIARMVPFLVVKVPLDRCQQQIWENGKSHQVDMVDRPEVLRSFKWALANAGKIDEYQTWSDIKELIPQDQICGFCHPRPPALIWEWARVRRGRSIKPKPFECTQEANRFETQLKARPPIVSTFVHGHGSYAIVEVQLNIAAMLHRVLAVYSSESTASTGDCDKEARWRIVKYDPFSPPPIMPKFILQNNSEQQPAIAPPRFSRKLYARQCKALTWMQSQEEEPEPWCETEEMSFTIRPLDWQIQVEVSQQKLIRGGIIADDVGSGKTTAALALVGAVLPTTSRADPVNKGLLTKIWCDTTLILVPQNILKQWEDEMKNCYGEELRKSVEIIKKVKDLKAKSISDITKAMLIIAPWDFFDNPDYWSCMRQICCAPNVPHTPGRAFQQWLKPCLEDLGKLVQESSQCSDMDAFWTSRERMSEEEGRNYNYFTAFRKRPGDTQDFDSDKDEYISKAPSNISLGSKDYQSANPTPLESRKEIDFDYKNALESWPDDKRHLYPLLHLFSFRRLIVDEFTYLKGKSLLSILRLEARNRWMLSGTPPLGEFDGINTMAKLLGTKLSSIDERDGCFGFGKDGGKMAVEKTSTEQFREYISVISSSHMHKCHEMADRFVQQFMRKDAANIDTKKTEKLVVVMPSVVELATYFEFYLPLSTQSFNFKDKPLPSKKGEPATATESIQDGSSDASLPCREEMISMAIHSAAHAEEALTCCLSALCEVEFRSDNPCSEILRSKEVDFTETCDKLLLEMQEAFWYRDKKKETVEQNPYFPGYLKNAVHGVNIGDYTIATLVDRLLGYACKHPQHPFDTKAGLKKFAQRQKKFNKDMDKYPARKKRWDKRKEKPATAQQDDPGSAKSTTAALKEPEKPTPPVQMSQERRNEALGSLVAETRKREMAARATIMNSLTVRLVDLAKSLRLFKAISSVVSDEALLHCSSCDRQPSYQEAYVLGTCGHVICKSCWNNSDNDEEHRGGCHEKGCMSAPAPQHLLPAENFVPATATESTKYGSKMDAIVKHIKAVPESEFVLVFVQYAMIKSHLIEVLQDGEIHFEDGSTRTASSVTKFINGAKHFAASPEERTEQKLVDVYKETETPRVLILMLDSADSAGWNLQVVNHVMFVSPLVARSQYDYDAIMEQAIGRSYRQRQTKKVHVYHFATAMTMDINILEDRHHQAIVNVGNDFSFKNPKEVDGSMKRFRGPALQTVAKLDEEEDGDDDESDAE